MDPRLFSPQALALGNDPRFPKADDPCGLTTFGGVSNPSEYLTVGRVDYPEERQALDVVPLHGRAEGSALGL